MSTLETTNAYLQRCKGVPPLPKGWIYTVDVERNVQKDFTTREGEKYSKTYAQVVVKIWDADGPRSYGFAETEEKWLVDYLWSLDQEIIKAAQYAYQTSFPKPDAPSLQKLEELLHGN